MQRIVEYKIMSISIKYDFWKKKNYMCSYFTANIWSGKFQIKVKFKTAEIIIFQNMISLYKLVAAATEINDSLKLNIFVIERAARPIV